MLHGVDEIAWDRLHGAYAAVGGMPQWLRDLRGDDPAVREVALGRVWDAVYHQGTRWQASGPAVPFLIELIDDPSTPDRPALFSVLSGAVLGDRRDDDLPFDPDEQFGLASTVTESDEARIIQALYVDEEQMDEELIEIGEAAAIAWERNAWQAAADRVDTIAGWLTDPDTDLAAPAAALLAWLPATPRSIGALLHASASANLTLAHLPTTDPRVNPHLQALLPSPDPLLSTTAAIALAYRLGDALPDPALTILAAAKDDPHLPPGVPGWPRALRGFVSLALQRLGLG